MRMTQKEIVRSFNESANKKKQITVLAELNACKEQEIVSILDEDASTDKRALGGWKVSQAKKGKRTDATRAQEGQAMIVCTDDPEQRWEKHFRAMLKTYAAMHGKEPGELLRTAEEIAQLKCMAKRAGDVNG